MKKFDRILSRLVKSQRTKMLITQIDLSKMAKISQSKISKIESGKLSMRLFEGIRICKILEIDLSFVINEFSRGNIK